MLSSDFRKSLKQDGKFGGEYMGYNFMGNEIDNLDLRKVAN